jgi:hypothetical protein
MHSGSLGYIYELQKVKIIEKSEFWLIYFLLSFTLLPCQGGPKRPWDTRTGRGRGFPGAGYIAPLYPGSVPVALGFLLTLQPDGLQPSAPCQIELGLVPGME